MGQQDIKDAVAGGAGEKRVAPTKKVSGDEVGQTDIKDALRLNGQTMDMLDGRMKEREEPRKSPYLWLKCFQEVSVFMCVNC